jgi:hypothetical protein
MSDLNASNNSAAMYKPLADRALTIGNRMNAWIAEVEQLESIPALTAEQEKRRATLAVH